MAVAPAGILEHFVKIISLSSRKDPQKGALIYIVSSLSDLKLKLEEIRKRLKERDDELLSNAVKALNVNDRERAAIYASEIAEVRRLIRYIQIALLAVERLLERMKTMNIVNDVRVLTTTIGVLNQLKTMFANTMPELAATLDTIVTNVNAIVAQTQTPELSVNVATVSKDVEDILKEIERQADEKIRHSLQPIPVQLENVMSQQVARDVLEHGKVVESMTSVGITIPTSYTKAHKSSLALFDSGIEYEIYNYIIANRGLVKVDECASIFGLSKEDVVTILRRLEQKGLIKIAT